MTVEMRIGHYCSVCLEELEVVDAIDGITVGDDDLSINVGPHRCDPKVLRECAERDVGGFGDVDAAFQKLKREALL